MKGPLPSVLTPVTRPLASVYAAVIAARNARYSKGKGRTKLLVPVVSVGNITTGGTGKSPFVRYIANVLNKHGCRPVIALRGYRGDRQIGSDEALEHRLQLPDIDVVVNPDRARALREYFAGDTHAKVVVLDDGFQHRQLARDIDIVLIDATQDTFHQRLLPAGHLREPLRNLQRATAVVVTRSSRVDATLLRDIERHHGKPPIAWTRHAWTSLEVHEGGESRLEPTSWLAGRRVATLLGVGNPISIEAQLIRAGALVEDSMHLRDHHRYGPSQLDDMNRLCRQAESLITTQKDWVKLKHMMGPEASAVTIAVPKLRLEFLQGESLLQAALLRCVQEPVESA